MPTKSEQELAKLKAHAEHLLDDFITLRERYAILRPMLHNKKVVRTKGSNKQYRGFIIIRNTLFLSCCQQIANIYNDKSEQSASISQLIRKLENTRLRNLLKDAYSKPIPSIGPHTPEVLEILKKLNEEEKAQKIIEFESSYSKLLEMWELFSNSRAPQSIDTIRKKVAAHTDIHLINGKYQTFNILSLDLKWDDIKDTINEMQKIIDALNLLIRNSSYYWEELDNLIQNTVNDYWEID